MHWLLDRSRAVLLTSGSLALGLGACGDSDGGTASDAGSSTAATATPTATAGGSTQTSASSGVGTATGTAGGGTTTGSTTGASTSAGTALTGGIKFDVGDNDDMGDTGRPVDMCKVVDNMDAVGDCEEEAPPDSFAPEVEWSFTDPGEPYSYVTPLVANLTDDDDNGEIDLCDIPDVIAVFGVNPSSPGSVGHVYVLDGETGAVHFVTADAVDGTFTPAIGDIDNDGVAEIVTATPGGAMIAFEHDGTKKWEKPATWQIGQLYNQDLRYSCAAALADLDADGDVEIIAANNLFDHNGDLITTLPQVAGQWGATTAADLDDDGDLEVVLGHAAYHHDGSQYYLTNLKAGYPQVADLDGDGLPEILLTTVNGVSLLEHDGTIVYQDLRPTGDPPGGTNWHRPATIHDFDGDGEPEFAVSSANNYTVYESDATIVWQAPISDLSGIAAGTAFDFLGDGVAEAMYADEQTLYVFDGAGAPLLTVSRKSGTLSEYPTVADIDNDGSAEILVVSNGHLGGGDPGIQVFRDVEERWIQARRIWNQHAYHVTNVREDGTIPTVEPQSWKLNNTFRTNAQIEGGGICIPVPPG